MTEKTRTIWQKDAVYVGLLLVITVATYAGFLVHPCIHDFYNYFFPERYFLIDCLRNHVSPLWNPFQSMGTPAHADPQTGIFYIPVRIFALFGPYHSVCCGIEFILHVFVGGWGFYRLCRFFGITRTTSFVMAVCYLMSGFFVGNAQHLSWIISGAWLPWLMYSTLQLLRTPDWHPAALTAIFASLMFTGGYPGFCFGFAYLVVLMILAIAIRDISAGKTHHFGRLCLYGGVALLLFAVLSMPTILSFIEVKPWITRGQSLDYSQVSHAFPAISSLLFPYAVTTEPTILTSDLTMRSLYVGILSVGLFIVGLCRNRSRMLWLLFVFGLLSLLVAYGRVLPFHRWAFYTLPLVSLVRIPTLMRIFFIMAMLLFAAVGLDAITKEVGSSRKVLIVALLILAVLSLVVYVTVSLPVQKNWENDLFPHAFFHKLKVDAVIMFSISALSALLLWVLQPRHSSILLLVILSADMVLHVLLSASCTIYNMDIRHEDLASVTQPRGRTVPQRLSNAAAIQGVGPHWLWRNAGMFYKQVEWDSYNPFILGDFDKMRQPYKACGLDLDLPIAFFPRALVFDTTARLLNEDTAYVPQAEMAVSYPDSLSTVVVSQFDPGFIVLKTHMEAPRQLVLAQNFYPGWCCEVDGQPLEIRRANTSMMTVSVPEGAQEVVFAYRKPFVSAAWVVEWVAFSVLLLLLACSCAGIPRRGRAR